MRIFSFLSSGLLTLVLGLSVVQSAQAAGGQLLVEQKSSISDYGQWTVTMPGDATYQSTLKSKLLNNLTSGTYKVDVVSPAGALTKITVKDGSQAIASVTGNSMLFDVKEDDSLRIVIEYIYLGTVRVHSDPAGVPFEMKDASGKKTKGVTPATFTEMEPVWYRVTYAVEASCEVQKDQQRGLIAGSTLTFWANFHCGDKKIPVAGRTTQALGTNKDRPVVSRTSTHVDMPASRVVQTASVSEVLAGGRIKFTIAVTNATKATIHNVLVSDQYDPSTIIIEMPILNGGVIANNAVHWEVPTIYAGQTWTTSFYARVQDNLVTGDRIILTAKAVSDETDFDLYPESWSSTVGVGVAYMPQTGDTLNLLLMLSALIAAALLTNFTNRRKQLVLPTA